jgi:hypothetical protein
MFLFYFSAQLRSVWLYLCSHGRFGFLCALQHHCRFCGLIFCGDCATNSSEFGGVWLRACDKCFAKRRFCPTLPLPETIVVERSTAAALWTPSSTTRPLTQPSVALQPRRSPQSVPVDWTGRCNRHAYNGQRAGTARSGDYSADQSTGALFSHTRRLLQVLADESASTMITQRQPACRASICQPESRRRVLMLPLAGLSRTAKFSSKASMWMWTKSNYRRGRATTCDTTMSNFPHQSDT